MNRILNRINIYGFCSEERGGNKKRTTMESKAEKKKENE